MSVVQPKIKISESERKQIYRAKLKEQLGEAEYKKQQAEKKRAYRAKIKAIKNPEQKVVQQVVEQVVQNITPSIVKDVESKTQPKITSFFKSITKDQYLKKIKSEPIRDLIKEIKTTMKKEKSDDIVISDNIEDEIKKITNKKNITSVKPLHVTYEGKIASKSSTTQYLAKLRTVYRLMFETNIDESIINELQKLMDGKVYNQGVINHVQFFKNINKIIDVIKKKYTNKNTLATYINAITSILSRIREYFPKEYDKIAQLNIDLSKQYQRERDTNDAPDKVINNLISFDDKYINDLVSNIANINDKVIIALYTLIPPRRIKDFQLMKVTYKKDFDKLNPNFNYLMFENDKPSLFAFYNHKTSPHYPEEKYNIPDKLSKIIAKYIESNDIVNNDYIFGRPSADFKEHFTQPKFTELLQKTFLRYTGKKVSVDLIRTSKSTHLDTQNISLAERKKVAQEMGHSVLTNFQYSKLIGVERLNAQPSTTPITVEEPTIKRHAPRSTRKEVNYDENAPKSTTKVDDDASYFSFLDKKSKSKSKSKK